MRKGLNKFYEAIKPKDIENKFYFIIMQSMINVKEFVYNKLVNDTTLSWYVWNRIYPSVAPLNNEWPCIVYNRLAWSKIDTKGIRNEVIQISVWWKKVNDNETIMGVITSLFNGLKESPVKYCDIRWLDETFDKEAGAFWNHVTVHIKLFETD